MTIGMQMPPFDGAIGVKKSHDLHGITSSINILVSD
jgi:hypothetical protein